MIDTSRDYTQLYGTVKAMTRKAILLAADGEEVWIPMSCIFEDDLAGLDVGVIGEVNVATWFCDKEIF